jgi:hypothetical protein
MKTYAHYSNKSLSFFRMNVSGRFYTENQNTYFMFNNVFFFRKSFRL